MNAVPYEEAFKHIVQVEGLDFTNDVSDPGGATKIGITLKTLREYKNNDALGIDDIKALTVDMAREIYFTKFYRPLGLETCTNIPACIAILDQACNRGIRPVLIEINELIGFKLNASYPTLCSLLNFYWDQRDAVPSLHYSFMIHFITQSQISYEKLIKENPKLQKYLWGWMHRTQTLLRVAAES